MSKELQTQITKLDSEITAIRNELSLRNQELKLKQSYIKNLRDKLALSKKGATKVSEHAILRYLERVRGISTTSIQDEILTPEVKKMVETLGNGTYPNGDFQVVIKDNVVVTVK
jgi:hypothetical protein